MRRASKIWAVCVAAGVLACTAEGDRLSVTDAGPNAVDAAITADAPPGPDSAMPDATVAGGCDRIYEQIANFDDGRRRVLTWRYTTRPGTLSEAGDVYAVGCEPVGYANDCPADATCSGEVPGRGCSVLIPEYVDGEWRAFCTQGVVNYDADGAVTSEYLIGRTDVKILLR